MKKGGVQAFFRREIWKIHTERLPPFKAFWIRALRVVLLVVQGFSRSLIQLGASSLTYYSLLALVPILVILFGMARGFFLEEDFKHLLLEKFSIQEQVVAQLITFAESSTTVLRHGFIISIGSFILLWSIFKIFKNVEAIMNQIWEVREPRALSRQFSDYLAILFICPVILLISGSLTLYLTSTLKASSIGFIHELSPILYPLLNLVPYLLTSFLFTFLYIFIPNTTVQFQPAFYAGLVTGALYQLLQWLYLYFQIGMTSYNLIYGSFAAFPLFLIWLHISWATLLLGAKIAFAFQNVAGYEFIPSDFQLSHRFKRLLSLRIMACISRHFEKNDPPLTTTELSIELSIPHVLTSQLLYELVQSKLLLIVQIGDHQSGYLPALSADQLTIKKVVGMMDERGESLPLPPSAEAKKMVETLEAFHDYVRSREANLLVKDL